MPKTYAKSTKKLTVPEHFYQPNNSRNWSVRLVPLTHLQPYVGAKEFRKSTGQSDLRRAIPIGYALIADKMREWEEIATAANLPPHVEAVPTALNDALIHDICAARLYSWMRHDDEERLEGITDEHLAEIDNFCRMTDTAMRAVLAQGSSSPRWSEIVGEVLDWCITLGYDVDPKDPYTPKLVREYATVERKAQKNIQLRNEGEIVQAPKDLGPRLSTITEPFRKHKIDATKTDEQNKHVGTMLNAWKLFVEFTGDIELEAVRPHHLFEFFKARMEAEDKQWAESRAQGFGKRTLKEIFGYAVSTGKMGGPNPVDGLQVFPAPPKGSKGGERKPRFPYSSAQINSLFASVWYDPRNEDVFRGKMRTDLGARYWVPLIGLFHGNRVREGVQLVASDFAIIDDLLVLTFRTELDEDEADEGGKKPLPGAQRSFKNRHSQRSVPVHPALVGLGLKAFIEARRKKDGVNAFLFPSSLPEEGGKSPQLGRAYDQSYLRFVRDRLAFGHGYGSHSWRHQLEDRIRNAQAKNGAWPAGLGQQFTGRKRTRGSDVGIMLTEGSEGVYGKGYSPESMLPYIKQIDFSDIGLPPRYVDWLAAGHGERLR